MVKRANVWTRTTISHDLISKMRYEKLHYRWRYNIRFSFMSVKTLFWNCLYWLNQISRNDLLDIIYTVHTMLSSLVLYYPLPNCRRGERRGIKLRFLRKISGISIHYDPPRPTHQSMIFSTNFHHPSPVIIANPLTYELRDNPLLRQWTQCCDNEKKTQEYQYKNSIQTFQEQ